MVCVVPTAIGEWNPSDGGDATQVDSSSRCATPPYQFLGFEVVYENYTGVSLCALRSDCQ